MGKVSLSYTAPAVVVGGGGNGNGGVATGGGGNGGVATDGGVATNGGVESGTNTDTALDTAGGGDSDTNTGLVGSSSVGAAACDAACASDTACAGAGGAGGQLSLSQQSFDEGELILNYCNGNSMPSLFTFENDKLVGQGLYSTVGITAKAWYDAGLCSLNNQAWEMRMDFSFPTEQTHTWDYMILMFDQGTNIGYVDRTDPQDLLNSVYIGHSQYFSHIIGPNDINLWEGQDDINSLQLIDTPLSWIVSRDAATGDLTLELYRDTDILLGTTVVSGNVFSDSDVMDNSKVPFSMYVNNMNINYDGFYLTAGARGNRRLDSNNRGLGGNNNNDNLRRLKEADPVAAFDVAATIN